MGFHLTCDALVAVWISIMIRVNCVLNIYHSIAHLKKSSVLKKVKLHFNWLLLIGPIFLYVTYSLITFYAAY